MKKITLTPREFHLFKQIAKFWYSFAVSYNYNIVVEADVHQLEELGY